MKPIREVNEERDSKYPPFRRYDAQNWRKWKFYPGAMILMPLRMVVAIMLILMCYVSVRLSTLGHSFANDEPIKGKWKNIFLGYIYKLFCSFLIIVAGGRTCRTEMDFDYSFYLGPDYK
jgi:hypothetical protein